MSPLPQERTHSQSLQKQGESWQQLPSDQAKPRSRNTLQVTEEQTEDTAEAAYGMFALQDPKQSSKVVTEKLSIRILQYSLSQTLRNTMSFYKQTLLYRGIGAVLSHTKQGGTPRTPCSLCE